MSAFQETLENIIDRLVNDAGVSAFVGSRVYSNIPQDESFPYLSVRSESSEFTTKDSNGFNATIVIDIWSDYSGKQECNQIADAIYASMQNIPYAGLSIKSLCLQFQNYNVFTEPDDETTHGVMNFLHLYSN